MAEPQPPNVTEGAEAPDVVPANAEDRKAAAAMNTLDTRGEDEAKPKKEVDMKAVQDAMKTLDVSSQQGKAAAAVETSSKKKEEPKKPLVKVDAADVALLVQACDLTKPKATEILRANDANVVQALKSWLTPSA